MANTDWNQPTTATLYTKVLTDLKELAQLGSTLMRIDNPSSGPDPDDGAINGSIKWSSNTSRFVQNVAATGAAPDWSDLAPVYEISATSLGGAAYDRDYFLNIGNPDLLGTLRAINFNDVSHGNRLGGTLHALASSSTNGFMTAVDKVKLDGLKTLSDAEVATAYHNEVSVMNPTDFTGINTKTTTPANLSAWIDNKLKDGVYAVTFKPIYPSGTTNIDVKRGQYQELTVSIDTSITFQRYPSNPFTMYLYITPNGKTVTVPTGTDANGDTHRWSGGTPPAAINSNSPGIDLLTINYDGKGNFFYMLLADMQ